MEIEVLDYFLFRYHLLKSPVKTIKNSYTTQEQLEGLTSLIKYATEKDELPAAAIFTSMKMIELVDYIQNEIDDKEVLEELLLIINKLDENMHQTNFQNDCNGLTFSEREYRARCLPNKQLICYSPSDLFKYVEHDYDVLFLLLHDPDKLSLINPEYVISTCGYIHRKFPEYFETIEKSVRYYMYTILPIVKKKNKVGKMAEKFDTRINQNYEIENVVKKSK